MRWLACGMAVAWGACGGPGRGAIPPAPPVPVAVDDGDAVGASVEEAMAAGRATDLPRAESTAFAAWDEGSFESAIVWGCDALRAGVADRPAELRRVVARSQLAVHCPAEALTTVGSDVDIEAVRLSVRARALLEDWAAAAELAHAHPDAISASLAQHFAALAAESPAFWQATGATCARAPLTFGGDVPTIPIRIDGEELVAAVASIEPYSLVREGLVASHVANSVIVGDVTVGSVPLRPIDLSTWSNRAGVEIGAVLGQDFLLRWGTELDVAPIRSSAPELRLRPSVARRVTFDQGEPLYLVDGFIPTADVSAEWPTATGRVSRSRIGQIVVDTLAPSLDLSLAGRERLTEGLVPPATASDPIGQFCVDRRCVRSDELSDIATRCPDCVTTTDAMVGRIGVGSWMLITRNAVFLDPGTASPRECTPSDTPWPPPPRRPDCARLACDVGPEPPATPALEAPAG